MRKYTFFFILLAGCSDAQTERLNRSTKDARFLDFNVSYYKDIRTKTCFAGTYPGSNWATLTYVPCNEAIEASATKFSSQP